MHVVVSLLDGDQDRAVRELWAELEHGFGVRGVYVTPFPHFSYQVAAGYDTARVGAVLTEAASRASRFRVSTAGLGIFTGPKPVLYLPVVRTPELTAFHQELWSALADAGEGVLEYYHPDRWMPHITIGYGDLTPENLSPIIQALAGRALHWEVPVTNLALIYDRDGTQGLEFRHEFAAPPQA